MSRRKRPASPVAAMPGELDRMPVTLVGHPFAPIGMGEQLRSHLAALRAVKVDARVFDVFRFARRDDPDYLSLLAGAECDALPGGIRIFHVNGDEVERVLAALRTAGHDFGGGRNVVVPAWELPRYPATWVRHLRHFDEVWALSGFIQQSLLAGGVESALVGQSVEVPPGPALPRRFFGIPESAFVLMSMFDLSSYAARKNPDALLDLFDMVCAEAGHQDVRLVLKVKDGENAMGRIEPGWASRAASNGRVILLKQALDGRSVHSLLRACDVFVSLHRSEGFGRGLGEAMASGRVAMGTGWSGNLDFMTERNALLVRCGTVPVGAASYPHGRGQHWAEADVLHAMALLRPLLAEHADGRSAKQEALARRGQADVLHTHGHRAVGLRLLDRLERITAGDLINPRP